MRAELRATKSENERLTQELTTLRAKQLGSPTPNGARAPVVSRSEFIENTGRDPARLERVSISSVSNASDARDSAKNVAMAPRGAHAPASSGPSGSGTGKPPGPHTEERREAKAKPQNARNAGNAGPATKTRQQFQAEERARSEAQPAGPGMERNPVVELEEDMENFERAGRTAKNGPGKSYAATARAGANSPMSAVNSEAKRWERKLAGAANGQEAARVEVRYKPVQLRIPFASVRQFKASPYWFTRTMLVEKWKFPNTIREMQFIGKNMRLAEVFVAEGDHAKAMDIAKERGILDTSDLLRPPQHQPNLSGLHATAKLIRRRARMWRTGKAKGVRPLMQCATAGVSPFIGAQIEFCGAMMMSGEEYTFPNSLTEANFEQRMSAFKEAEAKEQQQRAQREEQRRDFEELTETQRAGYLGPTPPPATQKDNDERPFIVIKRKETQKERKKAKLSAATRFLFEADLLEKPKAKPAVIPRPGVNGSRVDQANGNKGAAKRVDSSQSSGSASAANNGTKSSDSTPQRCGFGDDSDPRNGPIDGSMGQSEGSASSSSDADSGLGAKTQNFAFEFRRAPSETPVSDDSQMESVESVMTDVEESQ
ncbi:hypothetical protein HDU98_000822 [Podochytrium sp. JEL0797]|nr:hypothetical protein HDU98_000822 [Podochytrium sp. JEL0797]